MDGICANLDHVFDTAMSVPLDDGFDPYQRLDLKKDGMTFR